MIVSNVRTISSTCSSARFGWTMYRVSYFCIRSPLGLWLSRERGSGKSKEFQSSLSGRKRPPIVPVHGHRQSLRRDHLDRVAGVGNHTLHQRHLGPPEGSQHSVGQLALVLADT